MPAGRAEGTVNRKIEEAVHGMGGHKSLYSEAFYSQETFEQMYGGDDPGGGTSTATTQTADSALSTRKR